MRHSLASIGALTRKLDVAQLTAFRKGLVSLVCLTDGRAETSDMTED
jgi:hypothetical protein